MASSSFSLSSSFYYSVQEFFFNCDFPWMLQLDRHAPLLNYNFTPLYTATHHCVFNCDKSLQVKTYWNRFFLKSKKRRKKTRKEGKKEEEEGGKSNKMKKKRGKNKEKEKDYQGFFCVLCFWFLLKFSTMVGIPSCDSLDIHESEREMWINCNEALCSSLMIFLSLL